MRRLLPFLLLACQPINESETPDVAVAVDARVRPLDAAPDVRLVDASVPDGAVPDVLVVLPDAVIPDAALDGPAPDVRVPDAALPVPCPTPWTRLGPDECPGRRVATVTEAVIPGDVAITATPTGRVVLAYSELTFVDAGNLEVRVLDDASQVVAQETVPGVELEGELIGHRIALAHLRETTHILTWVRSDLGGRIEHRTLSPDDALGPAEVVTGLVGREGAVDVAVAQDGTVHAAWSDKSARTVVHRARDQAGDWGQTTDLDTHLESDIPGEGAIAVALAGNAIHVAYQLAQSRFGAVPRLRSFVGDLWGNPRTLDNVANSRVSGVGLDLTLVDETRVVAYVDWVGGTGQLRLAELASAAAEPTYDVRNAALPLERAPSAFPLRIASAAGRLHLVALRPGVALEYHVRGPGGWAVEVIDDVVPEDPRELLLDLFVSPDGAAHIAYHDATDGMIHHAVRRP